MRFARKDGKVSPNLYLALIGLVVLLALFGAGCPEEEVIPPPDNDVEPPENDVDPPPDEETIRVNASPGNFDPDEITVSVGQTVTFVVENLGPDNHTFTIDEFGVDIRLNAGDVGEETVTFEEAGTYEFYCAEPGHREAGMYGTLVVE